MIGLSAGDIEDASGIACTQAGGLMSAQFESEVKRMQHEFAARNGLLAALLVKDDTLASGGSMGKFTEGTRLDMCDKEMDKEPRFLQDKLSNDLGHMEHRRGESQAIFGYGGNPWGCRLYEDSAEGAPKLDGRLR